MTSYISYINYTDYSSVYFHVNLEEVIKFYKEEFDYVIPNKEFREFSDSILKHNIQYFEIFRLTSIYNLEQLELWLNLNKEI